MPLLRLQQISNNCKSLVLIILTLCGADCLAASSEPYSSILGLSTTHNQDRNLAEFNLMLPAYQKQEDLFLFDIKLKQDNQKSFESNLGLVYRHNFLDKVVFGLYGYFDRRKTQRNLVANQLTIGLELLSPYLDGRFNIYIPENKKKVLALENKKFVRVKNHTSVYVTQEGAILERPLKGYDVEIGTPLFTLLPKLDERFGTKIFLANYKFSQKNMPKNSGFRVRAEQKIKDDLFSKRQSEVTLHLGSSYTNRHKWNNFVALSFRVALSKDATNSRKSKMQQRMMDMVVRDIDIITRKSNSETKILPVYWEGKKIHDVYFVAEISDDNYVGNGSYEQPFSRKELMRKVGTGEFQKKDTDLIIPIKIEETLREPQYQSLVNRYSVVDIRKHDVINFVTADKTSFCINNIEEHFPAFDSKKLFKPNASIPYYDELEDYPEFLQEDYEGDYWQTSEPQELEVNKQSDAPSMLQSSQENGENVPLVVSVVTSPVKTKPTAGPKKPPIIKIGPSNKFSYVSKNQSANYQSNLSSKPTPNINKPKAATRIGSKSIIQTGPSKKLAGRLKNTAVK